MLVSTQEEKIVVTQTSAGPRERYRQQVRAEVQKHAWRQVAEAGASALSLKAIAKQMGLSAPALYRYFASRDDLLTELILSAYRELAEVMEAEAAAEAAEPAARRLTSLARAMRDWALANPQRYLLLFGTPVPGYAAPPEATVLSTRIFVPVLAGFSAAVPTSQSARGLDPALRGPLAFWTRLHGVLSLELSGHFTGMGFEPAELYAAEVGSALAGVT
jgi:AcrR family transcriptional regulator